MPALTLTSEIEARKIRAGDHLAMLWGERLTAPAEVTRVDLSDLAHGWVWVYIPGMASRPVCRFAQYELLTITREASA
jgi:hypothetical protein